MRQLLAAGRRRPRKHNRFHCSEASIRFCEELDRSHLHLAHRGAPELALAPLGRRRTVTVGRYTVLCGCVVR